MANALALFLLASLGLLQLTSFISFGPFPPPPPAWEGAEEDSRGLTCKFQIDLFSPLPSSPQKSVFDAISASRSPLTLFLRFLLTLSRFPWIDCWGPGLQDKAGRNPTNQPTKTEPKALELFFTLFRIFLHVTETERRPPEALAPPPPQLWV